MLGTVGEPINPEAWRWYHETIGEKRCPIVDTWWQTETGGHMIAPLPGAWAEKPGSATLPFFGAAPVILDPETGKELDGEAAGVLCFKQVRGVVLRAVRRGHAALAALGRGHVFLQACTRQVQPCGIHLFGAVQALACSRACARARQQVAMTAP